MKLLARAAAVSATVTGLVMVGSSYASAAQDFEVFVDYSTSTACTVQNEAGSAKFVANGEHIYLNDLMADNKGIGAKLEVEGERDDYIWTSEASHFNMSYAEGADVKITVFAYYPGGSNQACGHDAEYGEA